MALLVNVPPNVSVVDIHQRCLIHDRHDFRSGSGLELEIDAQILTDLDADCRPLDLLEPLCLGRDRVEGWLETGRDIIARLV